MHRLLFALAALLTAVPAFAASDCNTLKAAILKVYQVPVHLYMTDAARDREIRNAETIYLNGTTFVKVNGPWRKSQISTKDLADSIEESDQKLGPCTVVGDEAVNGEAATLYKIHTQTADETADSQIWISKSRGLPLKQISEINVTGAAAKRHSEIRYEYTNVTAPAVTERPRK